MQLRSLSECRGAQDALWDSQSPQRLRARDRFFVPGFAPLRGHGFGPMRLRHDPYDE